MSLRLIIIGASSSQVCGSESFNSASRIVTQPWLVFEQPGCSTVCNRKIVCSYRTYKSLIIFVSKGRLKAGPGLTCNQTFYTVRNEVSGAKSRRARKQRQPKEDKVWGAKKQNGRSTELTRVTENRNTIKRKEDKQSPHQQKYHWPSWHVKCEKPSRP